MCRAVDLFVFLARAMPGVEQKMPKFALEWEQMFSRALWAKMVYPGVEKVLFSEQIAMSHCATN